MRLTDDELQAVLARAEEIQRGLRHGEEMDAELEAVIGAAEEVGIARPAVERALRERLNLPAKPPTVGSLAFAKSADGKFYAAEVLALSRDGVRVRFLRGSEHTVEQDELRPFSFIPGERVVCNWPWWGPWTCTVVAYDAARKRVKVSDGWGYTRTFPVAEVWLPPSRKVDARGTRLRVYLTLLGAGAGIGALVGSLVTALLTL
jgi:hypothetical protein